jgi:hypothetical protein
MFFEWNHRNQLNMFSIVLVNDILITYRSSICRQIEEANRQTSIIDQVLRTRSSRMYSPIAIESCNRYVIDLMTSTCLVRVNHRDALISRADMLPIRNKSR